MIIKAFKRLKKSITWRKEHINSWEGFDKSDQSGITKFQRYCINAFHDKIQSDGIKEAGREKKYLTGKIEGTSITVFINDTSVEMHGPNYKVHLEEWNFETPDYLISKFIELCVEAKQFYARLQQNMTDCPDD